MTVIIPRPPTTDDGAAGSRVATPISAAAAARAKAGGGAGRLYQPRIPIYPKLVHGFWRNVKWALLIAMLGIYYAVPWLRWARPGGAPQQAVLIDFTHQRFYFFFIQLWPQEIYFITGLLVMAALALFLVTALFGRLWCGYACPQTIWTDLFIVVERAFEGDRNARMKLDAAPLSLNKIWRKGGKHAVWLLIATATGGAWIFYFHDAPTVWRQFWVGQAPLTAYVSAGLLTFTTYALAGFMREQVCTYLCPWPRIQGAMLDEHSMQVMYLPQRGEPRGPHKKAESWEGRGDCVDCNQCVVVCPMGIDIRDGPQIECINCGLCVDACDEIMVRVGRPKGLIAYDTESAEADRAGGRKPRYQFIRSRTIYYGATLSLVVGLMTWGLMTRSPVVLEALRDRNPTFVRLHDGSIRNGYTLKIDNRGFERRQFQIALTGLASAQLKIPGAPPTSGTVAVVVEPNQVRALRMMITAPASDNRSAPVTFTLTASGVPTITTASTFLSGDVSPP